VFTVRSTWFLLFEIDGEGLGLGSFVSAGEGSGVGVGAGVNRLKATEMPEILQSTSIFTSPLSSKSQVESVTT